MTEIKQVIVVRKDLNMRKGKLAAQVSHASMAFLVRPATVENDEFSTHVYPVEQEWLKTGHTKVVVSVDSEDGLLDIVQKASESGLEVQMVTDLGKTEFHGQETLTCAAIGPDYSDKIDKVTGHLKLI